MPDEKANDRAWVSREEYDRMERLHGNNLWAWWQDMPKEFGIDLTFEMGDQGVGCAWRLQK